MSYSDSPWIIYGIRIDVRDLDWDEFDELVDELDLARTFQGHGSLNHNNHYVGKLVIADYGQHEFENELPSLTSEQKIATQLKLGELCSRVGIELPVCKYYIGSWTL